ncbi:MAG: DUF4845 domain-containing protein [Burkholderiales bacterium]
MRKQDGLSLSGFLLWSMLLVLTALLGLKMAPAYLEYLAIQKQLRLIAADSAVSGRGEIEKSFSSRAVVENIKSVTAADLEITREDGKVVISVAYSVKVPLFANISVCMDFSPTSAR